MFFKRKPYLTVMQSQTSDCVKCKRSTQRRFREVWTMLETFNAILDNIQMKEGKAAVGFYQEKSNDEEQH